MKLSKVIFFIFCIGIISINSLHAQDICKCDYIASGYYQLVYEAEIAYLEGNEMLAYEKLQEAERACPLLNQSLSQEMELYGQLLLKNRNFNKTIHYMEKLATEYGKTPGYILSALNKDSILLSDLLLQYPTLKDSILPAILQKCDEFYTPKRKQLATELRDILMLDQEVRKSATLSLSKIKETDSLNAKRFFEIVEEYGYPNEKQYGGDFQNMQLYSGIDALIVHISVDFNIEEMILRYVREGECAPAVFGSIIDKAILEEKCKTKSLYGVWDNVSDSEIIDILHLDERRMAIGMPTRAMHKRRAELLKERNE